MAQDDINDDGPIKSQLGFREWTSHYEKEQEADRDRLNEITNIVGSLGSTVSKLSANMETLIDNQKGMFNRLNRPWQWGVVVAGFMAMFSMAGMFGVMANLIVAPMQDTIRAIQVDHDRDVERNLELHMWFKETLTDVQVKGATTDANVAWLMRMEERLNNRLHRGYTANN